MDGCKEHNVKQSKPDRKTNVNFFFYTKSIFRSDRVIEGHEQERGREQERVAAQRIPSVENDQLRVQGEMDPGCKAALVLWG